MQLIAIKNGSLTNSGLHLLPNHHHQRSFNRDCFFWNSFIIFGNETEAIIWGAYVLLFLHNRLSEGISLLSPRDKSEKTESGDVDIRMDIRPFRNTGLILLFVEFKKSWITLKFNVLYPNFPVLLLSSLGFLVSILYLDVLQMGERSSHSLVYWTHNNRIGMNIWK